MKVIVKEDEEHDQSFQQSISKMTEEIQRVRLQFLDFDDSLGKQRQENALLLSRKTDASRQVAHSTQIIKEHLTPGTNGQSLAKDQPLDAESERRRREMNANVTLVKGQIDMVTERSDLLERCTTSSSTGHGSKAILTSVMKCYQKSNKTDHQIKAIESKILTTSEAVPLQQNKAPTRSTGRTTYGLFSPASRRRPKIQALPLGNLASPQPRYPSGKKQDPKAELSALLAKEAALQGMTQNRPNTVKLGSNLRLNQLEATPNSRQKSVPRKMGENLLLSPTNRYQDTPSKSSAGLTQTVLFSPPSKSQSRSGWDRPSNIDQAKMKQISFSAPNEVKEVTVASVSKSALAPFGTTPEKVKEDLKLNKAGFTPRRAHQEDSRQAPPATSKNSVTPATKTSGKEPEQKKTISSSSFPPLPTKAPTPVSKKLGSATPSKDKPPLVPSGTAPAPAKEVDKSSSDKSAPAFGSSLSGMKGLGDSLFSPAGKGNASASPFGSGKDDSKPSNSSSIFGSPAATPASAPKQDSSKDYHAILTEFYQKHNPSKVGEVSKNLEKYKGREIEMFQKLATKYKVPSPLSDSTSQGGTTTGAASQATGFGSSSTSQTGFGSPAPTTSTTTSASPFGASSSGFGSTTTPAPASTSSSGFGMSASTPFSSSAPSATSSPFGAKPTTSASPFGATPGPAPSSIFGGSATGSTPSAFGSSGLASPSPFGQSSTPGMGQSTPFGSTAAPAGQAKLFNGKTARDLLTQFYQEKNPTKVSEVDKLLQKYSGNEEQMFRNLAKKYGLDPSVFGVSAGPPALSSTPGGFGSPSGGFGQQSMLGGGGMSSTFGGASPFGSGNASGSTFGQSTPFGASSISSAGSQGFGALAQSSGPSAFGAGAPSSGFGSIGGGGGAFGGASPFGAPRR